MQQAFIIRAFKTKKDSAGKEVDFERIHSELIAPAIEAAGLGGGTTGKIIDAGNIREDMFGLILEADLVARVQATDTPDIFSPESLGAGD